MNFTLRFQDTDTRYQAFRSFAEYDSKIMTWDYGIAANWGRLLSSSDGVTWATETTFDPAVWGNTSEFDGAKLAIYNGSIFISRYDDLGNPKILEWDGTTTTGHLSATPQSNYDVIDMVVWNDKLWVLTDATPFFSDRRVVSYYDGSIWTDITDYHGVAYLTYNKADGFSPITANKHRTSRLFVFNEELYLLASRWHTASLRWAWQVLRFNAETYTEFDRIYDSEVLDDNFLLTAVFEYDGKCYVIGNEISAVAAPLNTTKLYSSEDMEAWTEENDFDEFLDEFDDAARHANWIDTPNNGTITEAGAVVTYAVAGAVNGNWWQPNVNNAPISTYTPSSDRVTVIAKLNSYTVNDQTNAGILIGNTLIIPDNAGTYCYTLIRNRNDAGAANDIGVVNVGKGTVAGTSVAITTLPIWFRIDADGSGAGSVIKFYHSVNGSDWTLRHTLNNFTWTFIGLHVKNWGAFNAISAPFEYFRVYETIGFMGGEATIEGQPYVNALNTFQGTNHVYYLQGNDLKLDSDISSAITDTTRCGGAHTFNNGLYVGKYREIFGAPGVVRKGLRSKKQSLAFIETEWVNKLGETLSENIAPIDVRAPARFYEGRIKSMSSLRRAIDDRTGIFQIANLTVTLANHDMRYSKRLSTHFLKNQEAKLYHCWADEPWNLRRHVITMVVWDYRLKGNHFELVFKDITQKYFESKVPRGICTVTDYPSIHPDHEGRYVPEVLGAVSLTTGEHRGAVEAVYVNTGGPPYQYVASYGQLNNISTVYSNDVDVGGGNWAAVYGTPTLINITPDQGDNRITFDCDGYSFAMWDDPTNGFVQNPAYVIAYYLRIIMGLPASLVNLASMDTLADYYTDLGVSTSGQLIIQSSKDSMEVLRQLLFSYGAKGFVAMDGKFKAERKDIHNYTTDDFILEQIEGLKHGNKKYNLPNAINVVKTRYGYIPWANLFKSAQEGSAENYYGGGDTEDDIPIPEEPLAI